MVHVCVVLQGRGVALMVQGVWCRGVLWCRSLLWHRNVFCHRDCPCVLWCGLVGMSWMRLGVL